MQLPFVTHFTQTKAEVVLALVNTARVDGLTGEKIEVALEFQANAFLPELLRLMGALLM